MLIYIFTSYLKKSEREPNHTSFATSRIDLASRVVLCAGLGYLQSAFRIAN